MASKEEADKARKERLLNRNTMKELAEQDRKLKEGKARIQEGRQQLLKERETRKEEMRKLVNASLDQSETQKEKERTKAVVETLKEASHGTETESFELKYPSWFSSFGIDDDKLSAKSAPEVQFITPQAKHSRSVGDEPRGKGYLGILEHAQVIDQTPIRREKMKTTDISVQQDVQLRNVEKPGGTLKSVDEEIIDLDRMLKKFTKGDMDRSVLQTKVDRMNTTRVTQEKNVHQWKE